MLFSLGMKRGHEVSGMKRGWGFPRATHLSPRMPRASGRK